MTYCTADDIASAYGSKLLDKISTPPGSTVPDPNIVERGITSAESIIDAYIAGRYTLPLAIVPPVLTEIAIDIAVYKMPLGTTQRTPEMRIRYDDAMKMLTQIAQRQLSLGLSDSDLSANGDRDTTKQGMGRSIRTYRI